jgi:hypothetical protein
MDSKVGTKADTYGGAAMKRFVVKSIETCPECQGEKWISDPTGFWPGWREHQNQKAREGGRLTPDEFEAYVADHGYDPHRQGALPPEEVSCGRCDGTGELVDEISLEEAIACLKAGRAP